MKLGILGGMGPLATSIFYHRFVRACEKYAHCDQDHIDTIVWSDCSFPDRTRCIQNNDSSQLFHHLRRAIKVFEESGCQAMCFPCNTMHYFFDDIQAMTSLPVIHMIDETFKELAHHQPHVRHVYVLSTDATYQTGLYHRHAQRYGINLLSHTPEIQQTIMSSIYSMKATGERVFPRLSHLVCQMLRGEQGYQKADKIILGCTEMSCVNWEKDVQHYLVDAMDVLVQACVKRMYL